MIYGEHLGSKLLYGITTLTYNLKEAKHVELAMYNMIGAKVATLVNDFRVSGVYNVNVNVDKLKLSPGFFYPKINVGLSSQTIKIILCEQSLRGCARLSLVAGVDEPLARRSQISNLDLIRGAVEIINLMKALIQPNYF